MSYVTYDLSLYRNGYRPYGETDPFAATTLNGVKPTPPGSAFAPWRLHGLGQSPVFTERGGYKLHGLGAAAGIPNGSLVTYRGTWMSVFNTGQGPGDPQTITDNTVAALNADGQLTVMQAPQGLSNSIGAIIGSNSPFGVTLVLEVTNGLGFGSVNDIISIIRHYVYTASGQFPQSDSIVGVQVPQDAAASAAASPTNVNYQAAGILNPGGFSVAPGGTATVPGTPVDFTTWLSNNAGTVAAIGIGLLVGVPLLKRLF